MYNLFARALVRQLNRYSADFSDLPDRIPSLRGYGPRSLTRYRQQAPVHLIAEMREDMLTLRRHQLSDRRLITASEAINDLTALAVRPPAPPLGSPPLVNLARMS